MPAPTNIDFLSATDIGTSLPYSNTQDVRDSGINYTVYYSYVAQAGDIAISIFGFGDVSPGYQPIINVYTGSAASPVVWTSDIPLTAVNVPLQIPVVVGETYFFEFISLTGNTPTTANLTLEISRTTATSFSDGDLFVPDDTSSLPGVVLNGTTGVVRRFVYPFPAGEAGDILADGTILVQDLANGNFALYSSATGNSFPLITSVAYTGTGQPVLRACNGGSCFYAGYPGSGATHAEVKRISSTGTIGSSIGPFASAGLTAIAVKNDETILYYAQTTGGAVKTWNIAGNIAGSDLIAGLAGYAIRDILYLDDDTLCVLYYNDTTKDQIVKNIDTTGAVLNTYNFGVGHAGTTPKIAYAIDNPNSFWVWEHLSGVTSALKSKFSNIKISDGSTITSFTTSEFENGAYNGDATATPSASFGISFSCPFFILRVSSSTATLIVTKTTVPSGLSKSFDYTTTGGLSPSTFSLMDGQSQVFSGLAAGTYGITETSIAGWTIAYTVSNANPHDAIVLAGGDTVTVIVTNTPNANIRSGIYKIVPGKRNDTLWLSGYTGTEDVKIP